MFFYRESGKVELEAQDIGDTGAFMLDIPLHIEPIFISVVCSRNLDPVEMRVFGYIGLGSGGQIWGVGNTKKASNDVVFVG